jgi:hypothetical protein
VDNWAVNGQGDGKPTTGRNKKENADDERTMNNRKGKTMPTPSTRSSPASNCSWGGSQVLAADDEEWETRMRGRKGDRDAREEGALGNFLLFLS